MIEGAKQVQITVHEMVAPGVPAAYRITEEATGQPKTIYAPMSAAEAAAIVEAILDRHRGDVPEVPPITVGDLIDAVTRCPDDD